MRIVWCVAGLALLAAPAWAVNYRNPAHDAPPGQYWLGISYEDQERKFDVEGSGERTYDLSVLGLSAAFGLFTGGVLDITLGSVAISGASITNERTGVEAGVQLRLNLDAGVPLDPSGNTFSQFRKGVLVGVRLGNVEDKNGTGIDYRQYDVGFGAGTPLIRQVQLYAGAVLSTFDGTVYSGQASDRSVDSGTNIGAFAGLEYQPQNYLLVGGELHLIHEWGIGLYIQYAP